MTTAVAEAPRGAPVVTVREALGRETLSRLSGIAHLRETASTNDRLLALPAAASHGWVVFADAQTRGRGRQGHGWWSPPGAGVYLSVGWCFPQTPPASLGPLSLRVGLAVAEALAPWTAGRIRLKWPNDLLAGEAKLGGLLLETRSCGEGTAVVVGIGVNVSTAPSADVTAGEPATCLAAIATQPLPTRECLIAALVDALAAALATWHPTRHAGWLERWRALDALADAPVSWTEAGQFHEGVARGPAEDGSLRVLTAQGERRVASGALQGLRPFLRRRLPELAPP